jgi:hypothetical protein
LQAILKSKEPGIPLNREFSFIRNRRDTCPALKKVEQPVSNLLCHAATINMNDGDRLTPPLAGVANFDAFASACNPQK